MTDRIYFDNASTTPLLPEVIEVMHSVMREDFGNPSSIHSYGRRARKIIEDARKSIAGLFNASIGEIFFTSCATEANNTILKNAVRHLGVKRIISSPTEHHCVLHTLDYIQENDDATVDFVHVDREGNVDLDQLEKLLEDGPKTMVSLMMANNEIGTMIDIGQVSALAKGHGALFHTDAVQAIGKYPLDVSKHDIDYFSASAHKFHGPKGVGFFYMNQDHVLPPFIHGGGQERNMRAGTENIIGIAGMSKALEIAYMEMESRKNHISRLREKFKKGLIAINPEIRFNGNQIDNYLHHVLSVSFPPSEKVELLMFNLDIHGICASSGSACTSGIEQTSHVLEAIGVPMDYVSIRFSFSPLNTLEEVEKVLRRISEILLR